MIEFLQTYWPGVVPAAIAIVFTIVLLICRACWLAGWKARDREDTLRQNLPILHP